VNRLTRKLNKGVQDGRVMGGGHVAGTTPRERALTHLSSLVFVGSLRSAGSGAAGGDANELPTQEHFGSWQSTRLATTRHTGPQDERQGAVQHKTVKAYTYHCSKLSVAHCRPIECLHDGTPASHS
jgi:hypothetical protein